jgi:hypothetical protein
VRLPTGRCIGGGSARSWGGYEVAATLAGFPDGITKFLMTKRLA